jgi:hypothetical protein
MDDRSRSRGPGALLPPDALTRNGDDEQAASAARARYRTQPMPALEPDRAIGRHLEPGERLLAVRRRAILERRQRHEPAAQGLVGDLYLTSARLVHLGRFSLTFRLDEIEQVVLSGSRLLLVMREGAGVSLEVDDPRLLRVEIATARAAARS